ncbi:MAG: hypothetical protein WC979_06785 [Candidatus Pacearchaeota archaeon]|jgi:hypothetical protein
MQDKKAFLFMYPQKDILDFEIRNHSWSYDFSELQKEFEARLKATVGKTGLRMLQREYSEKAAQLFRPIYSQALNKSIDLRYRKNGFRIFYALLNDAQLSETITLHPEDRVVYTGMDIKTHRTPDANGNYPYPSEDFILDKLGEITKLVVSGFHLNDCVQRVAKRAYERKIDVLVDEELTELFGHNIRRPEFNPQRYPSINLLELIADPEFFKIINEKRKERPWLYNWQEGI